MIHIKKEEIDEALSKIMTGKEKFDHEMKKWIEKEGKT